MVNQARSRQRMILGEQSVPCLLICLWEEEEHRYGVTMKYKMVTKIYELPIYKFILGTSYHLKYMVLFAFLVQVFTPQMFPRWLFYLIRPCPQELHIFIYKREGSQRGFMRRWRCVNS